MEKTTRQNRLKEALGRIYDQQPPYFRDYLRRYQEDPTSRVFAPLADAYRQMGKVDEAIEICEKGLETHPNFPGGRVALAKCYLEKKWHIEAKRELDRVVNEVPENLMAHRLLGEACLALKDTASALHAFKMAFMLSPTDVQLAEKIKKLEENPQQFEAIEDDNELEFVVEKETQTLKVEEAIPIPFFEEEASDLWNPSFEEKSKIDTLLGLEDEDFTEEAFKTEGIQEIFNDIKQKKQKEITSETLADLYLSQGQIDRALLIYEKIQRKEPNTEISKKIMNCRMKLGVDKDSIVRTQKIDLLRGLLKKVQQQA